MPIRQSSFKIYELKDKHIFSPLFFFSVKCITAALKRTPIKDKEHAVKPLRSPKSKKVKRKLSLEDDDSHDSDGDNDRNTDDDQQQEAVEFHNCDSRIPIYSRGKTVTSP